MMQGKKSLLPYVTTPQDGAFVVRCITRKAALSVQETSKRSAVVLDELPLWLEAVEKLLGSMGFQVVGKTTEPKLARALIAEHQPDVFVTSLPAGDRELDGMTCLRQVRAEHPKVTVVVLSSVEDPTVIDAAFSAGAAVYCLKKARTQDLVSAIRQVFEPSIYFAGARFAAGPESEVAGAELPAEPKSDESRALERSSLTKRELEILRLVGEGHSNSSMARMLWVTEQTIKFHLSNIYRKLNVSNRTEASRWAQLNGLLPPPAELTNATAA
jgi:two-component system response regulator DevR